VPRAGKSSIARAMQQSFAGVWMNLGVDNSMRATPRSLQPGIGLRPGGERPDLEPVIVTMYEALYESVAAHARLGLNVVVDVGHHDSYSVPRNILPRVAGRLLGVPVLFVGVRCPLEEIIRRRVDGAPGEALLDRLRRWQVAVHDPGVYDLEVDTSTMTPEQCATAIAERLRDGPPGSAFAELAH
jgi:chloramphenicol 3-O phosphotransferase